MTEVETKSPAPPVIDHPPAPEQANEANENTEPETSQFPPQGPSGQPFPPHNFGFFNYPPGQQPPPPGEGGNPDPNAPPNGNGSGPVPYPPPPGMMYPYAYPQPPPGYMPVSMSGMPLPGALVKPKRKQVKMACTNCAAACKRCDVSRPCERCQKYGLAETCRDGQRKERKKGFKRGPYNKRKRQEEREAAHEWDAVQNNPNGEWSPNGPSGSPFPGPPQQGQFPPPPEGYYPAFYALAPPPPGPGPQLVPVSQSDSPNDHPVEGQPDGSDQHANGQNGDHSQPQGQPSFPPPHAQFVYPPLAPGSFPPFGYPFPGPPHPPPPQQPQPQQQQQQQQEASSPKKRPMLEDDDKEDDDEDPPTPPRKKRGRRNSDGEWPGASKRTAKSKIEAAAPTRRSTRRSQQHVPEAEKSGTGGDGPATDPATEGTAGDEGAVPQAHEESAA